MVTAMFKRISLYLFALLATAGYAMSASASTMDERWPRWYIGVSGSLAMQSDGDVSAPGSGSFDFDSGYGFGAALGYMPASEGPMGNMRFEAEFLHQDSGIDTFTPSGGASAASSGNIVSNAYMLNAFYDFPVNSVLTPYVGAGIGTANVTLDNAGTDEDDQAFAYQFLVGVGYTPSTIPMTQFSLGYRYFATSKPSYTIGDVENSVQNLEAGVKLRF